ncbi:lanthionine synthetase C family protein [Streptomyces hyaluromycini]|uniref:lanthionine synthetase C family protein n=1 Tax=Streptomyces hyaluromycini TaxID=1377993 RepID=UPI00142DB5B0|nr:lanthionine synthetase C family protein [Streptomyces hyaluromycini]
MSLASGLCGTAVLFAELSDRRAARAHLAAAVGAVPGRLPGGVWSGVTSLAFAACAVRGMAGGCETLLEGLDRRVEAFTQGVLAREEQRLAEGGAGVAVPVYDVVSGLAGVGRYLLLREGRHRALLDRLLACLVRLGKPVRVHGRDVPGWWTPDVSLLGEEADLPRGHLNVGLAHGIAGPLALLALAARADVRVPGQDEAVERMCDWLLARRTAQGLWPAYIAFDEESDTAAAGLAPGRLAWCYGTPGVARAVYLAGCALSRASWRHTAVDALARALDEAPQPADPFFCHGWSGVLNLTWRMARDSGDPHLAARLPALAGSVADAFDARHPFGFGSAPLGSGRPGSRPGLLDGAAGCALALHAYASGKAPAVAWDAAFLTD